MIKCKYKFQDKEKYKFQGKLYCTSFSELCVDLSPCDDNCQIYEDYKELERYKQAIKEIGDIIVKYIPESYQKEELPLFQNQ